MRTKRLFAMLSVLMSAAIAFAVGVKKYTEIDLGAPTAELETFYQSYEPQTITDGSGSLVDSAMFNSGLLTGVSPDVPDWDSMPLLTEIPWTVSDVTRAFHRAGTTRSCDLFSPDMVTFQKLLSTRPGASAAVGRQPVFSVALTMEESVRAGLPPMSKKRIESYLEDHILILQSRLYQDEDETIFYGDRLGAAFCAKKRPTQTIKPESMIGQAVTEFRTLGLWSPEETEKSDTTATTESEKPDRRTLVLAFRYVAGENAVALATGSSSSIKEYELIFVHMVKGETAATHKTVVFITSHGRTKFHQLQPDDSDGLIRNPSIVANVRFDDFKFFGLYPTKPVVTGIAPRARISMPVETVRARLLGLSGNEPVSLGELLDEIAAESNNREEGLSPASQAAVVN